MSVFVRERWLGCWRSLGIQLVSVLIVVPLFCLFIVVPLYLVNQHDVDVWVLAVSAGLFLLLLWGGGAGYLVLTVTRRARRLDALFEPLGLSGSAYQLWFRQYHGSVAGREMAAYFRRGPTLEIEVPVPVQTRLSVTGRDVDTMMFAGLANRTPMDLADPSLDELAIFGLDEGWARTLLGRPEVADALRRLVRFEGFFLRRQVLLTPGWLTLRLHGNRNLFRWDLDAGQVRGWFDALQELALAVEAAPAPRVTDEESGAERVARSIRGRRSTLMPALVIGGIVLPVLCLLAVGVAAYFWAATT